MKAEASMSTSAERRLLLFDLGPDDELLRGLTEVSPGLTEVSPGLGATVNHAQSAGDGGRSQRRRFTQVSEKMECSACRCPFGARQEQMEHYKLDWHRFNLKLKMEGLPPLSAEEFEKKSGAGDVSSISGSESDSEEEEEEEEDSGGPSSNPPLTVNHSSTDDGSMNGRASTKVVFQNAAGEYLSVHRCILQGKADEEQDVASSLKAIGKKTLWIILMTGGGHFAGAVFQGREVLQHKTFHRYTVRAKRGTAQGLRDSQNRSHAPKSAGAALRRHNEAALVKDVQELLSSWAQLLQEASAIFVRAPSYNKTMLFGGRAAPLDRGDGRVRSLPFATRRATFREVQRVHQLLSTVLVYGKDTEPAALDAASSRVWKKAVKAPAPANAQEEDGQESRQTGDESQSSQDEGAGEVQLEMAELTLGTLDLRQYEIHPSRHQRRRRRRRRRNNEGRDADAGEQSDGEAESQEEEAAQTGASQDSQSESRKRAEEGAEECREYSLRDALFTACKVGRLDVLSSLLAGDGDGAAQGSEGQTPGAPTSLTLLNQPIDSSGFTLLHVASAAAQKAVVRLLLDAGANPALRDDKGQTPYNVAPDKDTRNAFRKYMSDNPHRYDYTKAQIPGPLTAEMESKKAEKKKAQKAQKKQREKSERDEKRKQELEAEERKRFASLSDREKRALAAEKRLADQVAASGAALSNVKRCWQCGHSLLDKVPFHYLDFSFCSPRCLQEHRRANVPAAKS